MWGLLVQVGPEGGSESSNLPVWQFEDSDNREIKVGRTAENTFVVSKPYVSACHFSITAVKDKGVDKYVLKDFSSNGTFVNESRVGKGKTVELKALDRISLQFKNKTQLIYEFRLPDVPPDDGVEEPPSEISRTGGSRARPSLNRTEAPSVPSSHDSASAMRIAALERDNELQEQRIGSYITKLESSAREIGNLQRELQSFREAIQVTEGELAEERQHRLVMSSANAALEARCRSLDDTLATVKAQVSCVRVMTFIYTCLCVHVSVSIHPDGACRWRLSDSKCARKKKRFLLPMSCKSRLTLLEMNWSTSTSMSHW